MRDAELELIETAVEQRDEVAIGAAGRRVGMQLSLSALVQLRSQIRGSLTLRDVLLAMSQARAEQIAVREVVTEPMRKLAIGYAKEICLAVLHDGGITVGVQRVRNKPLGRSSSRSRSTDPCPDRWASARRSGAGLPESPHHHEQVITRARACCSPTSRCRPT